MLKYLTGDREPVDVCVLEGRRAVLEYSDLLEQLAERCGQAGAMHWLGYFLAGNGTRWKRPCLVLFTRLDPDGRSLRRENICAALLFYQLSALGLRTGAFATDDWSGRRTVIAPPEIRDQVVALAVDMLLDRGAHVVLTTYRGAPLDSAFASPLAGRDVLWAECGREATNQQMALGWTYDETLAKFGKRTRRNLRYHRKHLLARVDCEFVADACAVLSEDEFQSFNERCLNPVPREECTRRYHAVRDLSGGFLIGLRGSRGEWLSVLGGWRQNCTTVMYCQMNAAGYEKDSLNTVMRAFFLENEIARGTRTLVFYHGTNHPMSHRFDVEIVRDLMVRRRSFRAWVLRRLARRLASPRYYVEAPYFGGSTTFFAAALTSDAMEWHSVR